MSQERKGAPALGAFATKLAEAIARRHLLTQIAERGESVPAQITRDAEDAIRSAEIDLVRARGKAA
jgi:hypothetical protein